MSPALFAPALVMLAGAPQAAAPGQARPPAAAPIAQTTPTPAPASAPVPADAAKLPTAARALTTAPETTVIGRRHNAPGDPLEGVNRRFFRGFRRADSALLRPAALGYRHAVPRPLRSGLRNFFSNLTEPVVFVNYLLQFKPGKAAETLARFVVNSTAGVGGLIDVAKTKAIHLPYRPNGFSDTLGYYGVKPGPYFFLPFIGPTTLRDLIGAPIDGAVLPLVLNPPFGKLYYQIPRGVITGLDAREQSDSDLNALYSGAVDPYATLRSVYLQDRAAEIAHLHGRRKVKGGTGELGDPLTDPAAPTTAPAGAELADPLTDPAAPASTPATPPADPAAPPAKPTPSKPMPAPVAPSSAPELQDPLTDPAG